MGKIGIGGEGDWKVEQMMREMKNRPTYEVKTKV